MSKLKTFVPMRHYMTPLRAPMINVHTVDRQLNVHKTDRQLNVYIAKCDALYSKSRFSVIETGCERIRLHFQYKSQGITPVPTTNHFPL